MALSADALLQIVGDARGRVVRDIPVDVLTPESITVHMATPGGVFPGSASTGGEWLSFNETVRPLLQILANVTALGDHSDGEAFSVEIASLAQDAVIDLSGRPWPLSPEGIVLDAEMTDGRGTWVDRRGMAVPIGSLTELGQ